MQLNPALAAERYNATRPATAPQDGASGASA